MHIEEIDWDSITCELGFNARKSYFGISALAEEIEQDGLLQPLVVVPYSEGRYFLTRGFRRYLAIATIRQAAERAGQAMPFARVACIVRDIGLADALLLNLSEDKGRGELSVVDRGEAFQRAMSELHLTAAQLSTKISCPESSIKSSIYVYEMMSVELLEAIRRIPDLPKKVVSKIAFYKTADDKPDHARMLRELQQWQKGTRSAVARGPKTDRLRRLAEFRTLIEAIRGARLPAAKAGYREGVVATLEWALGRRRKAPVPLKPRTTTEPPVRT